MFLRILRQESFKLFVGIGSIHDGLLRDGFSGYLGMRI